MPRRPDSAERDHAPKVRVALEVRSLDRGGLETVVAELARGLPAVGIEPVVVCTESGGATADELRSEGVAVEVLSAWDRRVEYDAILVRRAISLVDAHYSTLGIGVAAARRLPVVVTLHNAYAWLGAGVLEDLRAADAHVSHYLAVSESVAEFCARRFQIDPARISVVRNGARAKAKPAGPAARARARAELGIAETAELVVQVGSVSRVKCQLALVDAMASLRDARPGLLAWLVGPTAEEDYADAVRRRIVDAGLEGRVVLTGPRDDVGRILAAADAAVLPSVIEGLSLAALEALGAGLPTIATRTGDAAFLLGEGRGGVLPGALIDGPAIDPVTIHGEALRELAGAEHPAHAPALAEGIAAVLDDLPARRAAALARGAELAATLSPEAMCAATAALLLRVAAVRATERAARTEELVAELDRERAASAELRQALAQLSREIARGTGELRDHLSTIGTDVSILRRVGDQTLGIATRTLDKLRLTHRVATALRGLTHKLRPAAKRPAAPARLPRAASSTRAPLAAQSRGPRAERWLILAVVPFDDIGGAQRSAQLARALVRRGLPVAYAARFPRAESVDLGLHDSLPGLELLDWDPAAIRAWLEARDERVRVVVEVPEPEALELARYAREHGARVLYDKVDDWAACSWVTWFDAETEAGLAREADDLVASAKVLAAQLGAGGRPVHLVPNAVDRALFRAGAPPGEKPAGAPPDLQQGARTLVYAGSLWGDWFDWPTLIEVATRRPDWRINLIGDPPPEPPPGLPPAIALLGLKPQRALPAYYAAADACLIPFIPSPLVDAVNPLKVYEYLAMHRPVVATPMPELRELPYVYTASGADETIAAVERAAATPPPVDQIEGFLAHNTWEARVESLVEVVARPTVAVVVLCYNNRDVIELCVDSLEQHRGEARYQVVVVDNGSTDGSLEVLQSRAERGSILLLRNSRNGCSSGRNLGIQATRSEIVAFLDSDQWAVRVGWLDPALEILAAHREIGAVAWNAGWFDPGSGRGPIVDYFPERAMAGAHAGAKFRTDVAYLATSGFVVPRAVLQKTNGFDEFYDPTCFEDTDLSFQIKAAGYALAYCPHIGVDHRPHQTTGSLERYDGFLARNEHYFLEKWSRQAEYFFGPPPGGD